MEFSGEVDAKIEIGERLNHPERVCLVGSTQFRTWKESEGDPKNADQVRGDLALESIRTAVKKGFRVVIVDGGSSSEFVEKMKKISDELVGEKVDENEPIRYGLIVEPEVDRGYSGSRRQALRRAEELREEGVKAIVMMEIEKTSITDNVEVLVKPILEGRADVVIPERGLKINLQKKDTHSVGTVEDTRGYPPYQAYSEVWANQMLNHLLVSARLKKPGEPVLDLFGGTRVIANDPEILEDFYQKHEVDSGSTRTNPQMYFDAVYSPIAYLLLKERKILSVPIEYHHPASQTATEVGVANFDEKRDSQRNMIFVEMARQTSFLAELKRYMAVGLRRFPYEMRPGFGIMGASTKGDEPERFYVAETPILNSAYEELKLMRKETRDKDKLVEYEGRTIIESLLNQNFRLFRSSYEEISPSSVVDHEEKGFVDTTKPVMIIRRAMSSADIRKEGFEVTSWGRVYFDDKNQTWTMAINGRSELDAAILLVNDIFQDYQIKMVISIGRHRDYNLHMESDRLMDRVFK